MWGSLVAFQMNKEGIKNIILDQKEELVSLRERKRLIERICFNRSPKYYEAGMDLGLSPDPYESYTIFQGRVIDQYDSMVEPLGLKKIDATETIHHQQLQFREIVKQKLKEKGIEIK